MYTSQYRKRNKGKGVKSATLFEKARKKEKDDDVSNFSYDFIRVLHFDATHISKSYQSRASSFISSTGGIYASTSRILRKTE
jgi:hypothetical protein